MAPKSAGPSSISTDRRLLRDLSLPRRRVRGVLQDTQPRMTVLAVDGSFASVLGGAPAAAAVFGGGVAPGRLPIFGCKELRTRTERAPRAERTLLETDLEDVRTSVRAEKLGEVAAVRQDPQHRRAVEVGSVDAVIPAAELRPASSPLGDAWDDCRLGCALASLETPVRRHCHLAWFRGSVAGRPHTTTCDGEAWPVGHG